MQEMHLKVRKKFNIKCINDAFTFHLICRCMLIICPLSKLKRLIVSVINGNMT